jgi:hypothetical protein
MEGDTLMTITDKEIKNVVLEGIDNIVERKSNEITELKVKCGEITQQIKYARQAITKLERLREEVIDGEV